MSAARKPPPFKLTPPPVPEVDVHAAIADALDLLLLPGTVWTTLPIGHVQLTGQQAARLARVGTKRGWFDILLVHNGTPYGIEIKRRGERLSKDRMVATRSGGRRMVEGQESVFPRLIGAGIKIATVESVDHAIKALYAWGIPVRRVER